MICLSDSYFLISMVFLVVVEKKVEQCKGNARLFLGREVQQDWRFIDVTVDYMF